METVSLFSGAGGLDLGASQAGAQLVYATDSDPFAARAHRSLLGSVPFDQGDVSGVKTLPRADLYLAAYPCQAFSQGGARRPETDARARLFRQFARLLDRHSPAFFVVENVSGLSRLRAGRLLEEQVKAFENAGSSGYRVSDEVLRAEEFGVPQRRRRLFIVGVRRDLRLRYEFPAPTHGPSSNVGDAFESHGDCISDLPLWPTGEFYELAEQHRNFPWWYMSRNRKARWDEPSYTVLANHRHVTLHPASPTMELIWSRTADKSKQLWDFSTRYEHVVADQARPRLSRPRRLSVRECARIQMLPDSIELPSSLTAAFRLVGNVVPPPMARKVVEGLVNGQSLRAVSRAYGVGSGGNRQSR